MGDVVVPTAQVTPLEEGVDLPSPRRGHGRVVRRRDRLAADDLAVIRAVYDYRARTAVGDATYPVQVNLCSVFDTEWT